jgi:TRAP-type C4-dicarboxylate transport system permease small subunit
MVRVYLMLFMLAGLGLIAVGGLEYLAAVPTPDSPIISIPFQWAAGAKVLAGVFLTVICAGLDELIRLLASIERHVRPAEADVVKRAWWRL